MDHPPTDDDINLTTLQAALHQHLPLILNASSTSAQQHALESSLHAISRFLLSFDCEDNHNGANASTWNQRSNTTVREALSTLLQTVGPEELVRTCLLDLLLQLKHNRACIQVVSDYLPAALEEGNGIAEQEMLSCLKRLVEDRQVVFLLPVFGRLSVLSLTENSQTAVYAFTVKALPRASQEELPELIQTLMHLVKGEKDAQMLWKALRHRFEGDQEHHHHQQQRGSADVLMPYSTSDTLLPRTANAILNCFASDGSLGSLLADTFVKSFQQTQDPESQSGTTCTELDVVILVILSQKPLFENAIDDLLDEWLGKGTFPFEALGHLLHWFSSDNCADLKQNHSHHANSSAFLLLQQHLVSGILRLVVFLLLSPMRRGCRDGETLRSIQSFVVSLHQRFEHREQLELLQSLLHLSSQASPDEPETSSGRKRQRNYTPGGRSSVQSSSFPDTVVELVHTILVRIANTKPESLVCFKHVLIDRLQTGRRSICFKHVHQICSVLAALVTNDRLHSSELVEVVQTLVFGFSGGLGGTTWESQKVVNGLLLAKALVAAGVLTKEEHERVKDCVLRVILPSTRRVLQPELGVPCLDFLDVLVERESSDQESAKKSIFQHVKMLLANTGLFQSFSQYQKVHKNSGVLFAYRTIPPEIVRVNEKTSDMLLCVNFFASLNNLENPARWECISQWVFSLIDTYLRKVRQISSRKLALESWVLASIEIAPLKIAFDDAGCDRENSIERLLGELNSFELQSDCDHSIDASFSRDDVSNLLREKITTTSTAKQFLNSVMSFEASLQISMAISMSVLKNAFEEVSATCTGGIHDTLRLQYQLKKIYNLRSKSVLTVDLLKSYANSIGRRRKRPKCKATSARMSDCHLSDSPSGSLKEVFPDATATSVVCIEELHAKLFDGGKYIPSMVLWKCIDNGDDRESVQAGIKTFLDSSIESTNSVDPSFLSMMEFRCEVCDHLSRTTATGHHHRHVPRAAVPNLARSITFILDGLPLLRTRIRCSGYNHIVETTFSVLVRLAVSYLRLLFNALVSSETTVDAVSATDISQHGRPEGCTGFPESFPDGQEENFVSGWAKDIFRSFSAKLKTTDESDVAYHLLELLSLIAIREGGSLLLAMVEQSWASLQFVYNDKHNVASPCRRAPYALSYFVESLAAGSKCSQPLEKVVDSCMSTAIDKVSSRPRSSYLQMSLLRHWGLLACSGSFTTTGLRHLHQLVNDLTSVVQRLAAPTTHRARIKQPLPSVPSLDSQTLPECFDTVASMIVGAVAVANPILAINFVTRNHGPYQHLKELFKAHRLLIALYHDNILLFSTMKRMPSIIFSFNRFVLAAAAAQLRHCVQWRSNQPPPDTAYRGQYDPGSLSHLRDFVGVLACNTVGMLFSMCGLSIGRDGDCDEYPFRPAKLRPIVGKIEREIKSIALTNNLPPPSFDFKPDCDPVAMVYMTKETASEGQEKENLVLEAAGTLVNQPLSDEDRHEWEGSDRNSCRELAMCSKPGTNSDEDSFGVNCGGKGVWGEDPDSDEKSTGSLDLHQSITARDAPPGMNGSVKFVRTA